jgi:hypothetical protein
MDDKYRHVQKWQAAVDRGGNRATCDLTGEVIGWRGQYHEILQRSWVYKGAEARVSIYQKELCAYLSPQAHARFHDQEPGQEQRDKIWQRLYELYGYDRVVAAFRRVQDELKHELAITLPDPENGSLEPLIGGDNDRKKA